MTPNTHHLVSISGYIVQGEGILWRLLSQVSYTEREYGLFMGSHVGRISHPWEFLTRQGGAGYKQRPYIIETMHSYTLPM